jgi:LPS-assembly protein
VGVEEAMRRYLGGWRLTLAAAMLAFGAVLPVAAQDQAQAPAPTTIAADEVSHDRETDVVTARGNVEIVQAGRTLRADQVAFDRRRNRVSATGNVVLIEPGGDTVFVDHAELTEDLAEGAVRNFRALLIDWWRRAAGGGQRSVGRVTRLRKVVYSPCALCREDPTRPPLWQIKAASATHDAAKATIAYRDAWLEVAGVPVLYTPYIDHPDGTVKRQSGLLAPSLGSSTLLGQFIAQPYYLTLGPSADATIEPIVFTREYPVLAGEYRQRTRDGAILLNASLTSGNVYDLDNRRTGDTTPRSHIAGTGRFDIDDTWRWGFDLARASHDNYLLRYRLFDRFRFIDRNTLTSRTFVEGFDGRSYATVQGYSFQGLRAGDDPRLAPFVLPMVDYQWIGDSDHRGGRLDFRSYTYGIHRSQGTVSQRNAGIVGYTLPYTAASGEVWTLSASLQGDLFHVGERGRFDDGFRPATEGFAGRVFPQMAIGWRWPFMRADAGSRTVVEPILSYVAGPRLGGQERFPNEDSRSIELDDTNLFRRNRYTGLDRLEGGQRVTYGMNADTRLDGGARFAAFLGQSYRFQREESLAFATGLSDNASNIVGRVLAAPHEWVAASWRFQSYQQDLAAARNAVSLSLGPQALTLSVGYNFIDRASQPNLPMDLEQMSTQLSASIDQNWRLVMRETRSLGEDSGLLRLNSALIYEDECFLFGIDFQRRLVGDRDNPPDSAVVLRFALRNLGETRFRAQ